MSLYATPMMGSELVSVIKLNKLFVNRHIKALSGTFCQNLVREVNNRIYNPQIRNGEQSSKREIPITACIGTRDRCVKEASARAIFDRIPPIFLDHDHRSIKEPESRKDRRYLALKNILEVHYNRWFHEQATLSLSNASGESKRAADVLIARCAHSLHERLMAHGTLSYNSKSEKEQRELKVLYLRIAVEFAGNMPECPMADVLQAALIEL